MESTLSAKLNMAPKMFSRRQYIRSLVAFSGVSCPYCENVTLDEFTRYIRIYDLKGFYQFADNVGVISHLSPSTGDHKYFSWQGPRRVVSMGMSLDMRSMAFRHFDSMFHSAIRVVDKDSAVPFIDIKSTHDGRPYYIRNWNGVLQMSVVDSSSREFIFSHLRGNIIREKIPLQFRADDPENFAVVGSFVFFCASGSLVRARIDEHLNISNCVSVGYCTCFVVDPDFEILRFSQGVIFSSTDMGGSWVKTFYPGAEVLAFSRSRDKASRIVSYRVGFFGTSGVYEVDEKFSKKRLLLNQGSGPWPINISYYRLEGVSD